MIIDLTDDEIELIKKAIISIGGDLLKDFIEYDVDNIDKLKNIRLCQRKQKRLRDKTMNFDIKIAGCWLPCLDLRLSTLSLH